MAYLKGNDGTVYPTWPMWVLSAVIVVDAVDMSILRGVLPHIQEDFELSDFQLGLLSFAFIFVNTLVAIPAGWVADRFRRNRLIGWTLVSWSLLSASAAGAWNFGSLFAARAALGFGQAIDDPASTSMLADYYPADVRGRMFSVQQIAGIAGGGIGIGLAGAIASGIGWRWAFLIMGIPGSLVALACFRLREPRRGEADGIIVAERSPTAGLGMVELSKLATRELVSELKVIFGIPTMRYILVGISAALFTASGVGAWLTIYHDRYSGMSAAEAAGATAGVLALGGIAGTLWGGRTADIVMARVGGMSGRIVVVVQSIFGCLVFFLLSFSVPMVPLRLLLQAVGMFAGAMAFPGLRSAMMDVTPAESRGVGVSAFALTSALFGTAAAPPIVGFLSDQLDSLVGAFYVVTPPVMIGALILLRAKDTIERDAMQLVTAMAEQSQAAAAALDAAVAAHDHHDPEHDPDQPPAEVAVSDAPEGATDDA